MHKYSLPGPTFFLLIAGAWLPAQLAAAQQSIGRTSAAQIQVSGAVEVNNGQMLLGNGSTVTAQSKPISIALTRGGELRLCSTTSVHLSKDRSIEDPKSTALMMALDRGALEARYAVGKYSDVLLTPDLRILISGPGEADLSIRTNNQGDTCVDNHGTNAPYVTVSSQFEDGAYRVMPDQRVMFEHGSLKEVVDHEREPCGCPEPPPVSVASEGATSANPAQRGKPVGGPSSTPADTTFPLAESEGLAPPPLPASKPVVPVGETHAEVTVPLTYNGENPPPVPPAAAAAAPAAPAGEATSTAVTHNSAPPPPAASPSPAVSRSLLPPAASASSPELSPSSSSTNVEVASAAPPEKKPQPGFFHRIGHFFSRIFG